MKFLWSDEEPNDVDSVVSAEQKKPENVFVEKNTGNHVGSEHQSEKSDRLPNVGGVFVEEATVTIEGDE
jgi:hypothetical protein